jgi:hypothetical protein
LGGENQQIYLGVLGLGHDLLHDELMDSRIGTESRSAKVVGVKVLFGPWH